MRKYEENSLFSVRILGMNNTGIGFGRLDDGMVLFVNGTVTGDVVTAKVIKVRKNLLIGRLEEITQRSPFRAADSFCAAPNACGGCAFRHLDYAYELSLKRELVRGEFVKNGMPDVEVSETVPTGDCRGYRNKGQYPVGTLKGHTVAGFYAVRSHNIIPFDGCAIQPDVFSQIVRFICAYADNAKIPAYQEQTGKGILRHIYLRIGKQTGEIMVCLVVNGELPGKHALATAITARFPAVASVLLNYNRKNTNVILGEQYELLAGHDYIEDMLCGKRFRISAGSFYQVNHDTAEKLYRLAAERAQLCGNETLLDLYCGAGTIGLSMSDRVKRLIGIEIVPEAVACAEQNARLNGVENAHFFCGDATHTEKLLDNAERSLGPLSPDVVILDPPQKGSTPELIRFLAARNIPKIVYISCGPDTLARDCKLFRDLGYAIGTVTPVDMFPKTGHVEAVCLLSKLQSEEQSGPK